MYNRSRDQKRLHRGKGERNRIERRIRRSTQPQIEEILSDIDIPDEIWDVDGAGTTGFVSNRSNRAY